MQLQVAMSGPEAPSVDQPNYLFQLKGARPDEPKRAPKRQHHAEDEHTPEL